MGYVRTVLSYLNETYSAKDGDIEMMFNLEKKLSMVKHNYIINNNLKLINKWLQTFFFFLDFIDSNDAESEKNGPEESRNHFGPTTRGHSESKIE